MSWWHGVDDAGAGPRADDASDSTAEEHIDEEPPWSVARLEAIEMVWGVGYMLPGGERLARKLMAVLGLTSKKSVLEFAPGLGGTARTLSYQHNLWMDALEPVEQLAIEGHRRSMAEGLGKRVPIKAINAATFELTARRYHAICSRDRLFTIADKERVLDQWAIGLKKKGQIVFTDFVVRAPDCEAAGDPAIRRPGEDAHFWTLQRYREALDRRGYSVLLEQDITAEYLDHIHTAWTRTPASVHERRMSERLSDLVIAEGEVWLARWHAIARGELAVARFHAQITASD